MPRAERRSSFRVAAQKGPRMVNNAARCQGVVYLRLTDRRIITTSTTYVPLTALPGFPPSGSECGQLCFTTGSCVPSHS